MRTKYIEEIAIKVLMAVSLLTVFGLVAGIIWTIFHRGWSCIDRKSVV